MSEIGYPYYDELLDEGAPCYNDIECCIACGLSNENEPQECFQACFCDFEENLVDDNGIPYGYCVENPDGWTLPDNDIEYKCCRPGEEIPGQTGNISYGDACNQFNCAAMTLLYQNEDDLPNTLFYHDDRQCRIPATNHNVVWNYFYNQMELATTFGQQMEQFRYFPVWNHDENWGGGVQYYYKENENETNDRFDNGYVFNPAYDRYQTGIHPLTENVLYEIPVHQSTTCDESDEHGGTGTRIAGAENLSESRIKVGGLGYNDAGIGFCALNGSDFMQFLNSYLIDNFGAEYLLNIFNTWPRDLLLNNTNQDNYINTIPSEENGFGLTWFVNDIYDFCNQYDEGTQEFNDCALTFLTEYFGSRRFMDVMFRIGFPYPPLMMYGEYNDMCTESIKQSYDQIINEWQLYIGISAFFTDFDLPGMKITPTMKNSLNVASGIDLREDKLTSCSHMEFMMLPGGVFENVGGDGEHYEPDEIPNLFLQYGDNVDNIEYIRNFDCNTDFDTNLNFSNLRAVCNDGSMVDIANLQGNMFTTLNPENRKFGTGEEACQSLFNLNSSSDLYYLSDGDKREGLGIYFYDSESSVKENFITNIVDEQFKQYPLRNFVQNGNGLLKKYSKTTNSNYGNPIDFDIPYQLNNYSGEQQDFDQYAPNYQGDPLKPYEFYPNMDEYNGKFKGDSDEDEGMVNPYMAQNWYPIGMYIQVDSSYDEDIDANSYDHPGMFTLNPNGPPVGMLPYWSSENSECFSNNKCVVMDTSQKQYKDDGTAAFYYDVRQGIQTLIPRNQIPFESRRRNQRYKVSFMMKTIPNDGVNLKDTGVHFVGAFTGAETEGQLTASSGYWNASGAGNYAGPYADTNIDVLDQTRTTKTLSSQCSIASHPGGVFGSHFKSHITVRNDTNDTIETYDEQNNSEYGVTKEDYCSRARASFNNTEANKWQKMEFTFVPKWANPLEEGGEDFQNNFSIPSIDSFKLMFFPLQFGVGTFETVLQGFLGSTPMTGNSSYFHYHEGLPEYIFDRSYTWTENNFSRYLDIDLPKGASKIYLDNFEFKEAFDFHTDVDVRKRKSADEYGEYSLTEYHDPDLKDTQAPMEVQFYFYPRQPLDDVFSIDRLPLFEPFKLGQFYISDIDWGDGSPREFVTEPKQIGVNVLLKHTYEKNGIFEIKGTMFQTKPNIYKYDINYPDGVTYQGNLGVGFNQKFTLKIMINPGTDDDYTFFGSDGFSFIPYKKVFPIIGGYSKQSTYYKNIKRNLGIIDDETFVDVNFNNKYEKFKTEAALMKMDSTYEDQMTSYKVYSMGIDNPIDTTPGYLLSLPFPKYLEEFDISNNDLIDFGPYNTDETIWRDVYARPDIADFIVSAGPDDIQPVGHENNRYYQKAELFGNPTGPLSINKYDGNSRTGLVEQLGKSIGDCDLTSVKFYNAHIPMYKLLGFDDDIVGTPYIGQIPEEDDQNPNRGEDNRRYWKNIIKNEMSITSRDGISDNNIDIYSEQDWNVVNENFGYLYYYPVLPKYGANGRFVETTDSNGDYIPNTYPNNHIPFPLNGPITDEVENNENLLINISSLKLEQEILEDRSGNDNRGFITRDFKPNFNDETLEVQRTKNMRRVKTNTIKGAF